MKSLLEGRKHVQSCSHEPMCGVTNGVLCREKMCARRGVLAARTFSDPSFFSVDKIGKVSNRCLKRREALHTSLSVQNTKLMCLHTHKQSVTWPRLRNN